MIVGSFRDNVLQLCRKVTEVVNNNDWPTEEGQRNEDGVSIIGTLVDDIEGDLE